MKSLLPISISDEHYQTLATLVEEFFVLDEWQPLVPLLIDTVPAQALPYLAEYFSVLGYDGWEYATTEAEQRALLKQAIELHRYKGTPWAVRTVVGKAGFGTVKIEEGLDAFSHKIETMEYDRDLYYDGTALYDGTFDYGSGNDGRPRIVVDAPAVSWALFRVAIILADNEHVSAPIVERIRNSIAAFKNERSWLTDIAFVSEANESLPVAASESLAMFLTQPEEDFDWAARYDGEYFYDGSIPYGSNNGITDTPDDEFGEMTYYNGEFSYDGTLYFTGTTNEPRLRFPFAANIDIAETPVLTESVSILINP